jgi:FKBP-type peptidyl-prolyl cis-trans isomerase 2
MTIEKGKKVAFDYTLTVEGDVVDTSKGKKPLEYTHGDSSLIPGLTSRMEGMKAGEERKIEVPSKEGYGLVNQKAFQEVPKTQLPKDINLNPGMMLEAQRPDGSVLPVKIAEVKDSSVVVDLNHPLAGKDLIFEVKIVSVS